MLGRWLVACQVALSVLLLVGAGLFVQTLRNLARVDVGFVADGLLQVSIDTRGAGYGPGQVGACSVGCSIASRRFRASARSRPSGTG